MECNLLTQEKIDNFKKLQKRKEDIYVEIVNVSDETKNELVTISSLQNLAGDWCITSDDHSIIPKIKQKNND